MQEETVEKMKKDFEEHMEKKCKNIDELPEKIEDCKVNSDWNIEYLMIDTDMRREYLMLETETDAEDLAKEHVTQDLEETPEIFNKEWMQNIKNQRIVNQTFNEYAAEQAVCDDGFAHFLASYDGDYQQTEHGYIIIRRN